MLLLHGFPQTHYCWHLVAPRLTGGNTVVVCDLKGYAGSPSEAGGPLGEGYGKRELAAELVELMRRLGFERFSVAGHDRGGRVAYRMALDHPEAVERLAVLNIVPTVDQFERMAADAALEYWPWFFLAQPPPFAERIVGASAEYVVRHILETWTARPGAIPPEAVERYVRAFTPAAIAGICAEFRAAFHLDRPLDDEDRAQAGGSRARCWCTGAPRRARCPTARCRSGGAGRTTCSGGPLASGHFIPEEAPDGLAASLRGFLR